MQVHVEENGPCRKTLTIEIPVEEVQTTYEDMVTRYSGEVTIPGYRKGKAPRYLVSKRYEKNIVQDVQDSLIPDGYREAIKQESIEAVAILGVRDVTFNKDQPMAFKVTLDVPPQFKLPKYQGMALKGEKVEISDDDVQKNLDGLLDQHASYEEVSERAVRSGDLVQVDFEGVCDNTSIDVLAPTATGLGKDVDFWVRTDEPFIPEFGDGLVGTSVGEKKQIFVDFPGDFTETALAGKQATYFVDVKAIREKKLPTLDKDFLATYELETEADLRDKIKEQLRHHKEDDEKRRLKNELVTNLLKKTMLDVPESLVQEETRTTIYDLVRQYRMSGADPGQLEERKQELFDTATKSATDKVKSRYILLKIAEKESIETSRDEVNQRIQSIAALYSVPVEEFMKDLQEKNKLDDVREEVRINKTLDFLLEQANIK